MNKKCLTMAIMLACFNHSSLWAAEEGLSVRAGQIFDELAQMGVIEPAQDGSYQDAGISRKDGAAILARSLYKIENEVLDGSVHTNKLHSFGAITKLLAKLERENELDKKSLAKVRQQYDKSLANVDKLAKTLARLTTGDGSAGEIRKCEVQYEQAVNDFGSVARQKNNLEKNIGKRNQMIDDTKAEREVLLAGFSNLADTSAAVDPLKIEWLKADLATELEEIGYVPPQKMDAMTAVVVQRDKEQPPVNFQGEIRYHNAANTGEGRLGDDDSRLRARLYIDADISQLSDYLNDSWRAYTMLEYEYSLIDKQVTNELLDRPRFYVEGMAGITKLTLGRYGYMLAEGNIYDTSFTGVKAEVKDDDITYRAGFGHSEDISKGYVMEADVDKFEYSYGAGLYFLRDNSDTLNTIMMAKGAYSFNDYMLGAMYLRSSYNDTHQDGYIYTLGYGKLQTWLPGSYNLFARYYDQGRNTYISHTMTGLGGRMNGFKGYQVGGYYTLKENIVAGLEYYDLRDKVTDESGRTLWSQVTYYF